MAKGPEREPKIDEKEKLEKVVQAASKVIKGR
jgi:hypothetical protein